MGNRQDGGSRYTLRRQAAQRTAGEPPPTNNAANRGPSQPRQRRQQIKLASLNMNGVGSQAQNKWGSIHNTMKRRKIALLALQESHPADALRETLARRFRNSLGLLHSADPNDPSTTNGVTIVINKSILNPDNIICKTVTQGRVMQIEIPWNGTDRLRIMNIYAPARNPEKAKFWEDLLKTIESDDTLRPDILLGDFNLAEHPELDRLVNRAGADPVAARNALSALTVELNLTDGWRRRHPRKRGYTYMGVNQSRLDRIYTREDIYPWCTDWKIEHPGFRTDHSLVSVQLSSEDMPFIGRGRWAIPVNLLKNKWLKNETQKLARKLQHEVRQPPTANATPQTALQLFKREVVDLFRTYQRTHQPKLDSAIKSLQKELENKADEPGLTADEIHLQSSLLTERIDALEKKRREGAKKLGSARNRLEGETLSKHWVRSAKENTPRDTIRALRNPLRVQARRETRSDRMAQVARDYHEQLLSADRDPAAEPDSEQIAEILGNLELELSQEGIATLQADIDEGEVAEALKDTANDKAAGLDGVPAELWKLLHQQYKSAKEGEEHEFCNIAAVLAGVFNDISANGITHGTNFNEGWMCPIYKKKEADNVANYRPITVLNTDYKIFTKAIATRFTEVAPTIIHQDQAGFIRGRSIYDQIEQAATTISYAKLTATNGAIVALDQEKAYDKLTHPYLWSVLKKFAFPEKMINMIKALYRDAPTSVIINGVVSDPFLVTRGVRQGDPMSCILFDLGIEPLAANIRASAIRGINIPNLNETVKVSLFADDTTVVLTENDSFSGLVEILDSWCAVSGAKFNVEKTEVIPIGSEAYRKRLTDTRTLRPAGERIPDSIHITRDGTATRILGAWVGNEVNPTAPWKRIVETIKKDFKRWEARFPTLEGKRHVVQMIAGGKTQFLARAQGMPREIEDEIRKSITEFVWGKKTATMCIQDAARSPEYGGRKILDIVRRNEAIDLMWVKQYLSMGPDRPKWAYLMDEIFRIERPKRARETYHMIERWNPLIQDWNPKARSPNVPQRIRNALRLASKHGIELETLEPTETTRREMPVWLHRKASREAARLYKTDAAKCLRTNHRTHYIGQLKEMLDDTPDDHRRTNFCTCQSCRAKARLGCTHPQRCLEMAGMLIEALAPVWQPTTPRPPTIDNNMAILRTEERPTHSVLVQTSREATNLRDSIRIFTKRHGLLEATSLQVTGNIDQTNHELVVYTDGSCSGNGTEEARAGSGVWYGPDDTRNLAVRVPGIRQTNQIGELLAILLAVKNTPGNQPLRIKTDSRFAMDGLTKFAPEWEAKDWIGVTHGRIFKCTTAWLRARTANTTLEWVKGHAGIEGNECADQLAAEGAQRQSDRDEIDLRIPADTMVTGAMLAKTSQSMIYHYLTNNEQVNRKATQRATSRIKIAIKELFGETPTEKAIWTSMRHKDITRKIRDFLWKHAHGIYRLGRSWNHIPGYENRAECPICNKYDTLGHIISECDATERGTVWSSANELWKRRYNEDIPTSEGATLGGGLANFRREDGKLDSAKNRLYKILVTESAHLIWVLRCERRIANEDNPNDHHTTAEVEKRWYNRINERMQLDCLLTNEYLYGQKALKTKKVYHTWAKCSTNTEDPHREWCRKPGFLVGTTSGRPPGRNR